MPHPEKILVVPRAKLESLATWQGFLPAHRLPLADLLLPGMAELRVRDEVEDDPGFRQVIPYTVLACRAVSPGPLVFCYTRGAGGSESRLHRRRSLGVGGHVEESDFGGNIGHRNANLFAFRSARAREVEEEVRMVGLLMPVDVGYVVDDSDPVGRVHLGVVGVCEVGRPSLYTLEPGTLDEAGWIFVGLLPGLADQFESWSRILIETGILAGGMS